MMTTGPRAAPTAAHRPVPVTGAPPQRPRTVLVCDADDELGREGLARWLATCTELAGMLVLEPGAAPSPRGDGLAASADRLAYSLYYRTVLRPLDREWAAARLAELCRRYPPLSPDLRTMRVRDAESPLVPGFLRALSPDLILSSSKRRLGTPVDSLARVGAFALWPGIAPQDQHPDGCFWALVRGDDAHVGVSLQRVGNGKAGIYACFRCRFDAAGESHEVIRQRCVFDNLDALREQLLALHRGQARPLDLPRVRGDAQPPRMSAYWQWKHRAGRAAME
jgi:hypothetical protein